MLSLPTLAPSVPFLKVQQLLRRGEVRGDLGSGPKHLCPHLSPDTGNAKRKPVRGAMCPQVIVFTQGVQLGMTFRGLPAILVIGQWTGQGFFFEMFALFLSTCMSVWIYAPRG